MGWGGRAGRLLLVLLAVHGGTTAAAAGLCPPAAAPPTAPLVLRSGLAGSLDGAPNAYHRANADLGRDEGLAHICYAVNILVRRGDRLVNRYPKDILDDLPSRTRCKAEYVALRDAGFPDCASGRCLRILRLAATPRSCDRPIEGTGPGIRQDCGLPALQVDRADAPNGFYVSATALSAGPADRQGSHLDARFIPYIALPPETGRPQGAALGDLALVVWQGRASFAVWGNVAEAGEASVATLLRLRGAERLDDPRRRALDLGIGPEAPATTILLPGTCGLFEGALPRTPGAVIAAGRQAADRFGGVDALLRLAGIEDRVEVSGR